MHLLLSRENPSQNVKKSISFYVRESAFKIFPVHLICNFPLLWLQVTGEKNEYNLSWPHFVPRFCHSSLGGHDTWILLQGSFRYYASEGTGSQMFRQKMKKRGLRHLYQEDPWKISGSDATMHSFPMLIYLYRTIHSYGFKSNTTSFHSERPIKDMGQIICVCN